MTALGAGSRLNTPSHGDGLNQFKFEGEVTDQKEVKAGSLVEMDPATGTFQPGGTGGTGMIAMGRADFSAGSETESLDPAPVVRVTTGVFSFVNHSDDFDNTMIGTVAYMVDDQTVSPTAGSLSPAGMFMGLDDAGRAKVAVSPLLAKFLLDTPT